jgi:hypothetical protein
MALLEIVLIGRERRKEKEERDIPLDPQRQQPKSLKVHVPTK